MKNSSTIKIKALSLFTVFSLNMLLGFACSLGINMGYNRDHHHLNSVSEKSSNNLVTDCHIAFSGDDNSNEGSDSSNDKDCCSNGVVKFFKLDKNISTTNVDLCSPLLLMVNQLTYQMELLQHLKNNEPAIHYFVQSDHPPLPDIRTAIQSFLI